MKIVQANIGNWYVQCLPEDGARISVLRYEGQDLLTAIPSSFKAPDKFHGEYEIRPVYGYDDCFPTVESCLSLDKSIEYRDPVSYTHLRAHETDSYIVCRLLLEKK